MPIKCPACDADLAGYDAMAFHLSVEHPNLCFHVNLGHKDTMGVKDERRVFRCVCGHIGTERSLMRHYHDIAGPSHDVQRITEHFSMAMLGLAAGLTPMNKWPDRDAFVTNIAITALVGGSYLSERITLSDSRGRVHYIESPL